MGESDLFRLADSSGWSSDPRAADGVAMATRRKADDTKPRVAGSKHRRGTTHAADRRSGRWSKRVMETSDALDLEKDVFKQASPRRIADSLKRSAERSQRRKAEPFRSAMSMLVFYINRAGKNLPAERKHVLEQAKVELRKAFGREQRS
jgi:hypothetical protein